MIKTFKRALAIMMTVIFVISLVPAGVMAETASNEQEIKLSLKNPIWVRSNSDNVKSIQNYGTFLRTQTVGGTGYKAFFQLNFTGYDHLLRDENSVLLFSIQAQNTSSARTQDFIIYAMSDNNDGYGDIYVPYNASNTPTGLCYDDIKSYVTPLTASDVTDATPFVERTATDRTTDVLTFIANKQVAISALDDSMDDGIVTFELVSGGKASSDNNKGGFTHNSANTFLQINSASENATPKNYLKLIADELSWSKLSADPEKAVVNNVDLPTKYKGVEIEWVSSNPSAFSSSGEVTMLESNSQPVTLKANMKYTDYNKAEYIYESVYSLTVAKIPTEYPVTNDGSKAFNVGNSSSTTGGICTSVPEANGVGGKRVEHDKYNNVVDSSGNKYIRPFNGGIPSDGGDVDRDIVEFSFCIPSTSKFAEISFNIYEADSNRTTEEFYIYSDGIYTNAGELIKSIKSNRWYNAALVAPISGSADSIWTLYINSEYAYGFKWNATSAGINYMGIRGRSEDASDTTIYIDNLKTYNGEFNAQYSKESVAEYEGIDLNGGTITLTEKTTAEDIINNMVVDADADIRIYNPAGELVEDMTTVLNDGYTIVVAAKCGTNMERTYSYYEIRVIEDGEFAFDVPVINSDGNNTVKGNVKLFNYSGSEKTYKIFLAVYSEGELIAISPVETLSAPNGEITEYTTNYKAAFTSGNKAKLFVWENNEITPALAAADFE